MPAIAEGRTVERLQVEAVHRELYAVIRLAVAVDAQKDEFPDSWLFHYRWGKVRICPLLALRRITHLGCLGVSSQPERQLDFVAVTATRNGHVLAPVQRSNAIG